jgi:hypothetical protein
MKFVLEVNVAKKKVIKKKVTKKKVTKKSKKINKINKNQEIIFSSFGTSFNS